MAGSSCRRCSSGRRAAIAVPSNRRCIEDSFGLSVEAAGQPLDDSAPEILSVIHRPAVQLLVASQTEFVGEAADVGVGDPVEVGPPRRHGAELRQVARPRAVASSHRSSNGTDGSSRTRRINRIHSSRWGSDLGCIRFVIYSNRCCEDHGIPPVVTNPHSTRTTSSSGRSSSYRSTAASTSPQHCLHGDPDPVILVFEPGITADLDLFERFRHLAEQRRDAALIRTQIDGPQGRSASLDLSAEGAELGLEETRDAR